MHKRLSIRFHLYLIYGIAGIIPVAAMAIFVWRIAGKLPSGLEPIAHDVVYGLTLWLIAGLALLTLFANRISKDMRHIIQTVAQVHQGDLTVQANSKALGELAALNQSLNQIIQQFHEMMANTYLSIEEVRHLTGTVSTSARESATTANQISVSADSVAKGASVQASDSEASARITADLIRRLEMVAGSAGVMAEKAEKANEITAFGQENVTQLLDKSNLSAQTIQEITQRVQELNAMAQNIGQITTVINGLARQTNLLSLNASIEASRAGDSGRGFVVVAAQIKKLAEQSLRFNEEIVGIISGIQEQINLAAAAAARTSGTLTSQLEAVRQTNEAFQQISAATTELFQQLSVVRSGMDELSGQKNKLSESIVNIAAVAQETAAATAEISSLMYSQFNSGEILVQLSANLDQQIARLDQQVSRFHFGKVALVKKAVAIITCVDIPFFNDTYEGARDVGSKLGFEVHCMAPQNYSSKEQAALIEQAIRQEVFGIGIGPVDGPEVRAAIEKALAGGIKVICFDTDLPGSGRHGFIGTDNLLAGKMMGEIAAKLLHGKGSVIGSTSSRKMLNLKQRIEGFEAALRQYPEISILAIDAPENSDFEIRWRSLKELIQKHSALDCFACFGSRGQEFARLIKEELKLNPQMISFDKTSESLEAVKNGVLTSIIAQRQGLWGELVVRKLNDLMLGKSISDFEDTGTYEINRQNISVFDK